MASNYHIDELKERVRIKLNSEKVKLWLPPYTMDDGSRGEYSQELVRRYSDELGTSSETMLDLLETLRLHALEKLAAKKKFEQSGMAVLKIKIAGNIPDQLKSRESVSQTVEVGLQIMGSHLRNVLAEKMGLSSDNLKLISNAKVVNDNRDLASQGIKNMSIVMAICLSKSKVEVRHQHQKAAVVAETREAAELLSAKEDGGADDSENYYLKIADQTGKAIDLPKEERKALVLAMTLHEKGRAYMKKKDYAMALPILLESDQEFGKCRADILNVVDNYALVCLDIAWCYLSLKNINDLPDAELRLKACDVCFRKSYGPNLERLSLVKGGTGTERALFLRLHLLQGIVAFHQHRSTEARVLFARAEGELLRLRISPEQLTQVMEVGFSEQEARLALRACDGNTQLAVSHIMKKRQDKKEMKEIEIQEKRKKKIAERLGKTASGEDVNIDYYESLLSMGFRKGAAAEALKQTNNDITTAVQVLGEHPELLDLPDPEPAPLNITDDMISQVTALGFDVDAAKAALHHFHGNIHQSIEDLLQRRGLVPPSWLTSMISGNDSSSSDDRTSSSDSSPEESEREKELMNSLVSDLPQSEEDHLDLTLEEEEQFLHEYLALVQSLNS